MFARFWVIVAAVLMPLAALAQSPGPLRIEINRGVIEPMPVAITDFVAESGRVGSLANDIAAVIAADLAGSGLFRPISKDAFIANVSSFDAPVAFSQVQIAFG